jgi:Protein of unknown function, DUF481
VCAVRPTVRWKTAVVVMGLAAVAANAAFARDKTDVIVMMNGDRITGEVKRLENGVLQVELDYVDGTIAIDWQKVLRIETTALFLVQLQDGSTYSGTIVGFDSPAGAPIRITIQAEGEQSVTFERSKAVRITETSARVWQRLSGNITAGATYSKGNSTAQYNFGSEVAYRETHWGGKATYDSNLTSSTGATTATRNQLDLIAYRDLPWKNYFYAGTGDFLQSSVQGVRQQTTLGFGVGRFLKNTGRVRLAVLGGFGWQNANYVPLAQTQQSQNIGLAFLSSNLQVFRFKKTRLNIDSSLAPAIAPRTGRLFFRSNASYFFKLFGSVDWNFSFYGNWDTQPPPHLPDGDYGTSTGLSWTFGNQ